MKKTLLLMIAVLVSVYAIGQKTQSAPSGQTDVNTPSVSMPSGLGTVNVTPESDYLSIWTLPSTNGTSANTRCPGNTFRYQRTEYIITAAEMAASGFPAGYEINAIGWLIGTAGATTQTGTLNVWLMNTTDLTYTLGANWTTSGFTQVHSDPAFTVPIAVGEYTVPFTGGSSFTYTGGGVYVAWEFSNPSGTLGTTAVVGMCNTTMASSLYGARSSTAMPTALGTATNFRPATKFGNNALNDIVAVTNVYTLGKVPTPYGTPTSIGARVANVSTSSVSFDLTITVKDSLTGTVRFTATQPVASLAAGTSTVVTFAGWTPTLLEKVTITATTSVIPTEYWTLNNTLTDKSLVNPDVFSHIYNLGSPGGRGFTYPGTGIFLSKYFMGASGVITGANLWMYNNAANAGNVIYAVVLNSAGTIVAQSANDTITAAQLGTNRLFTFPVPPSFCNENFYVGLAQTALGTNTVQWYPLGTISESPVRPSTFYTCSLAGGTLSPQSADVKYAIEAVVSTFAGVCAPTSFTAAGMSGSQIDLNWVLNLSGNPVLVAYNTTNSFGNPVNGSTYASGSPIPGGGTVIYGGSATTFSHTGLTSSTTYYYKVWSKDGSTNYSTGVVTSAATYFGVPYSQNFNTSTALPPSWSGTMYVAANHGTAASNGLTYNLYDAAIHCSGISPHIVLSANPCRLSFDYRLVDWSGYPATATVPGVNDKVEVQISTNSGSTWTTLYTIDQSNHVTSLDFASRSINLGAYTGTIKIRFYGSWGEGDYYVDIDNFLIEELPLCASPSALTVGGITTTNAVIGWSGAPFVEIDYGTPGHTAGTGTIISPVVNNPYTITTLAPGMSYDVYVRQDCGSGVYSPWVGPLSFSTLDLISVTPTPFDFGLANVGIPTPAQIFTIANNSGSMVSIETVVIEGTDASQFILTDGSTYPKNLNAGASYTVSVVFSPTSTGVKNAFLNVYEPEVAPHQAVLTGTAACQAPTDLTATDITTGSASLGWNANGTVAWQIEWGQAGFTQGTGTMITVGVTNPYTLSGLGAGSAYGYYVRANCGNGIFSPWAGPYTFVTLCLPVTVPYSQNFDGVTTPAIPMCWSRYSSAALRPWQTSSAVGAHSVPNSVVVFYHGTAPKNEWLVSPAVSVTPGTAYRVRFWVEAPGYGGVPERLKLVMSTDPSLSSLLTAPVLWDGSSLTVPSFTEFVIPFTPATAGPYYFAWHAYSVADVDYIAMDDISFEVVPPCLPPTSLSATGIIATAADLDWTETGTATKWDLEYGAPGFTPGTGTRISGITSKPYHLTGLTPATNYEFIVRADCGYTSYSPWSVAFPFTTAPLVPEFLTVTGSFPAPPVCFNATNTITVAGGLTTFNVPAGGSATFIAGMKILFLPGTTVNLNGYMLGKIAPTGPYCSTAKIGGVASGNGEAPLSTERPFFSLFPNPTNGNFTLVQKGEQLYSNVKVEIFGMNGEKMISTTMIGEKEHVFKTSDLPSGLYFVRVLADNYVETIKLVKTK